MIFIIAIVVGVLLGALLPFTFSQVISSYIAVGILAGLDSIFGAFVAIIKHKFNMKIFLTGFAGNTVMAMAMVYIGNILGIDIVLAAIVVFGGRLFTNFAYLRRSYILPNDISIKDKITAPIKARRKK